MTDPGTAWNVTTLHAHVQELFSLLRQQLDRQWQEERRATDIALGAHDEALRVAASVSKEAITSALAAQKEAVGIAQRFADQRADSMNEWRQSLNDVLTRAMPRQEAEAAIQRATERIQELVLAQQHMVTRAELDSTRTRDGERLTEVVNRLTKVESMAAGAEKSRASVFAALGIATSLIVAVIVVLNFVTR